MADEVNEKLDALTTELRDHRRDNDKRFEQVDKRFEEVDRRFDEVSKRFSGMMWLIGIGFVLLSTLMSLYSFL